MTDEELQNRLARLRVPPVDPSAAARALERAVVELSAATHPSSPERNAAGQAPPRHQVHATGSWRESLWPSPLAWGALAAIWAAILAHEAASRFDSAAAEPFHTAQRAACDATASQAAMRSAEDYRALLHDLQQLALRR